MLQSEKAGLSPELCCFLFVTSGLRLTSSNPVVSSESAGNDIYVNYRVVVEIK